MVFIDSDLPMYLVGRPHRHKTESQRLLERLVLQRVRLVTSAEVLQEIVHRYTAIDRLDAIAPAFETLLGVVDVVLPITGDDVIAAKDLILGESGLSARDAVHVAVMRAHGILQIASFDTGFDRVEGIERLTR